MEETAKLKKIFKIDSVLSSQTLMMLSMAEGLCYSYLLIESVGVSYQPLKFGRSKLLG